MRWQSFAENRRQTARLKTVAVLSFVVTSLLMLAVGCTRTQLKGGETRQLTSGMTVTISMPAGTAITAHEDTATVATTQASVITTTESLPAVTAPKSIGELGGLVLVQSKVKANYANLWWLIMLLGAAGIGLIYPLKQYVAGFALLLAAAFLGFSPFAAVLVGGVVAVLAVVHWLKLKQIADGIAHAKTEAPNEASSVLGYIREKVDNGTQSAIRANK